MTDLSASAQVAVLLMARWSAKGVEPLSSGEFTEFHRWMLTSGIQSQTVLERTGSFSGCPIAADRLESLLYRAVGVFQSVAKWTNAGLWVCYWRDPCYPTRFKSLKQRAPILLFGYGDPNAFTSRALAIVGSRNATEERLHKASEVARACARNGITVVSGGARGVDSAAMSAGIGGMGTVVGVLSDSLLRQSGKAEYRIAIQEKRLCLMSEVHPEARFDVRMAMARNRLAYACADAALVIECEPNKGGTWSGALEALRAGSPVYVLKGARAESQLCEKGAIPIDIDFARCPESLVTGQRPVMPVAPGISRVDIAVRTALEDCKTAEEFRQKLATSPELFGDSLWEAALADGWVPRVPAIGEVGGKPSTKSKRRTKPRDATPTLFVHEEKREFGDPRPPDSVKD